MNQFDYFTDDLAFKQVFKNKEILEDLITSFLDYIGSDYNSKVITELIPNSYLSGDNKKYRSYYGDLTASKEDAIISVEMYKDVFNKDSYNKSLGYLCRLYSRQEKSIKPKSYKKVMSINFIRGNYKRINDNLVNKYSFRSTNNEEISDNITMYLVRYDLVDKIPYKKGEARFITYLRLIGSRNIEKMKKYAKGDKNMEETIKMLREWNIESDRINYQRRIDEAKEEGREEGREEGEKSGKEYTLQKIIKNLIKKDYSKQFIMDVTALDEKEYEELLNDKK